MPINRSQRIMIIGCCGAGKSSLAIKLHEITGLPLIHLDQHYHLPNWTEPTSDTWTSKVLALAQKDQWIIDGNYGGTMDIRLQRADLIIFLDFPTMTCVWRILKRIWKYHGKVRPDMADGCEERFDWEFLHYTFNFRRLKRPGILRKLEKITKSKVIVAGNDKQVNKLLTKFSEYEQTHFIHSQ